MSRRLIMPLVSSAIIRLLFSGICVCRAARSLRPALLSR